MTIEAFFSALVSIPSLHVRSATLTMNVSRYCDHNAAPTDWARVNELIEQLPWAAPHAGDEEPRVKIVVAFAGDKELDAQDPEMSSRWIEEGMGRVIRASRVSLQTATMSDGVQTVPDEILWASGEEARRFEAGVPDAVS
jgi:hypothetical protein